MKRSMLPCAAAVAAVLFCLAPTDAAAQIVVKIKAGKDEKSSSVSVSGSEQHLITDQDRKTFKLSDNSLKNAVKAYFGKRPNDAFLKSPTPWNDLYKTYGWSQVQVHLRPVSAKITGLTSEPVIIAKNHLKNNSDKKASFTANISDQVTNTTSSTWSETVTLSVGQSITYEVGFEGVGSVGGETSMNFSDSLGSSETHSKSYTVGSSQGVTVELDPHESVLAELTATRGNLKVRVVYDATLTGSTAVNYNPTFKDHHFWSLSINSVSKAGKLPTSFKMTQDMTVGFYADASVTLKPD